MTTSMTEAADPASDTQWAHVDRLAAALYRGPAHPACVQPSVLGHSSVTITKDVYGHLVEGQERAAAELMSEQFLRDIGSQDGSQ
jgi:hypothetical protein